ncbi:MAG: alpha-amylase family protein [Planctomycetota bacterium]|nr:alpha-amylase family protein [Planctomycetota bacterium]
MSRKCLMLIWVGGVYLINIGISTADVLPTGTAPPAIEFKHFPDRLHTFVWRNWELVSLERMAKVLETTPENVREVGQSMGLPSHVPPYAGYQQRGYISIIRRNWHILPYEQLLTLLSWDAEKLAFTLREDDFLWIKLGSLKPSCPVLRYTKADESVMKRCAEIKAIVSSRFGDEFVKPSRPRFDFVPDMSFADKQNTPKVLPESREEPIRFLYSYFGVFGDPLLNPELDPYPDELLQRLSELGVNGVWLHVVLRQLAPSTIFPDFGADREIRIANLSKMVARAKRYGIKIYLYINEPRAMPTSFFEGREHIRGVQEGDHCALCTSVPAVRQWITDSLSYIFRQVPNLGGVFTITASENLTSCYSHSHSAAGCPRCSKRSGPEVIAEVNGAIAAGVWAGNPQAKVIVWDWGWPDGTDAGWGKPDWAEQIIKALPDNVYLMSVSEWGKPIVRGGVTSVIGEYSISAVGPGPRALRHWALAKKRGLKTIAKVQVNCSWELSAMPYLPVMNLVAQHCDNLTKASIDGLMLSWTVGGYPSPNLQLVKQFQARPAPTIQQALTKVAESRYSTEAAADVLAAWSKFSTAFAEYPFDIRYLYKGPTQYGPANLLCPEPTRYSSTMVGFPYDDIEGWRGIYPAEVLAGQFEKMAAGWQEGLSIYEKALSKTSLPSQHTNVHSDLIIAEAVYLHFKSVANQIRFILARNAFLSGSLSRTERQAKIEVIKAVVADEIQNAKRLFVLTREDPRIGFEASNHYYYLPLDLVEKAINCEYILNTWLPRYSGG